MSWCSRPISRWSTTARSFLRPHARTARAARSTPCATPLLGVITAITPFNHPLNQVSHKLAPAIATNNRIVLKPSEMTPLTALALADILYEAGLPPEMLSVRHRRSGEDRRRADRRPGRRPRHLHRRRVQVGKHIAAMAGYRRQVLELGGNDPLIVMEDADLEEAAALAVTGAYQEFRPALHGRQAHPGSGQRRRPLRRDSWSRRPAALKYGDPMDPAMDMGTVIDEPSAQAVRGAGRRGGRRRRRAALRQ